MKPSKQAELYYRQQMQQLVKVMQGIVIEELKNDTLNDSNSLEFAGFNDSLFSKGVERLAAQLDRITIRLESLNINAFAQMISEGFLSRLNRNNNRVMTNNIKRSTGIDLASQIDTGDIRQLLNVKIAENTALIKSIKNEYIEDIGKVVRDNLLAGERSTTLITEIKERGKVSENRAKLIARTETSKVNSQITQLRAEALGSKTYVWSTVIDERTRDDHKVMDGKLCKFSDPTVFSDDDGQTWKKRRAIGGVEINPGEIYNCRCVSMPVINFG